MPRSFRTALFVLAATTCFATGAASALEKDLESRVRALEKEIAAVRGLEFKSPVVARVIARPLEKAKKVQGYYSIQDKTLFLYDDISGAYEKGVLIHEMVHALQDQHFGLAKLHQTSFGSDAELALAALIEGDATFTMIELLKQEQPKVAAMLDFPLEKAKDLRSAFLYAQGTRYVKALKERGGWQAVNSAYTFPPRSTATVLHPEGVRSFDLGPGKTRGEFTLLEMFLARPETAPLAREAAAGWKSDRLVEHGNGISWVIALATTKDAAELHDALSKLKTAQNPNLKNTQSESGNQVWQDAKGAVQAVLLRGNRVLSLEASDRTAYQAILDRLEGPLPMEVIAAREKKQLSFGQLIDRLQEADVICLGETHDSELHHRVQLQVLKSLFARDERLGLGMEMFQRPFQKELDKYLSGAATEEEFLAATEYRKRWGYDWGLYQQLVEFCRRNSIPIAALNAPKELTSRISKVGYAGLNDDEKTQLGDVDFNIKEHRDYWYDRLAKLHGKTEPPKEQKERSYQVMTVWDQFMGESTLRFQQDRRLRRMLVLAGSGHIDHGLGIAARVARGSSGKVVTVRVEFTTDAASTDATPATDYVIRVTP